MYLQKLLSNHNRQIRAGWRILIFISLLVLAISPLTLIDSTHLQLFGAVFILVLGLYVNAKYLDKRDFSEYGLIFKKETFKYILIGFLTGAISVISILWIGDIAGVLSISEFLSVPDPSVLLSFGFKMLLVSILEETFMRGYLFTNLYDGFKSKLFSEKTTLLIALTLSSIFFGLAHFSNNNASIMSMAMLTINGVVWCIPFIITKNLGVSIGQHAAWNFTQTQLGFTMSGNEASNSLYNIENIGSDWLTGGDYGPEAGILGLIGFGLMLLMSLCYLKFASRTIN